MNATQLLTVSLLRMYFQGPATHWGIQCIDFDEAVDRHQSVSFNQTYPLPRLVCISSYRRCYARDGAHAIVAQAISVGGGRLIPLQKWPVVDMIPGDGRWPFCFGGGGGIHGGANVTATCGSNGDCLDTCFSDDDITPPRVVWCDNSTVKVPVMWDDSAQKVGWRPWGEGPFRDDSTDVIEIDSPLLINRASGTSVIARHGSSWIVRRNDGICVAPMQWSDGMCHVLVNDVCYHYDHQASVKCLDLMPFPPGAVVALSWRPLLVRSSVQPFEPGTTDLFCLESSDHDPARFIACLKKLYSLSRRGMSSLSPLAVQGRSSTVLIRVAPAKPQGRKINFSASRWGSIVISIALGVTVWGVIAIAASRTSSQVYLVETCITQLLEKFG